MADKTVVEVQDQDLGMVLRDLIEKVPETTTDDAQYRIVQTIMAARDYTELDAPWSGTSGLGAYNDQTIVIHDIRKAPSSFTGGPGIFLILDVEGEDGDHHVVTTGSISVVVQLLKAYDMQAFPLACIPKVSKRQSRNGYWPQHLEMVRPDQS